jgi:hypothetical protein
LFGYQDFRMINSFGTYIKQKGLQWEEDREGYDENEKHFYWYDSSGNLIRYQKKESSSNNLHFAHDEFNPFDSLLGYSFSVFSHIFNDKDYNEYIIKNPQDSHNYFYGELHSSSVWDEFDEDGVPLEDYNN